MSVRNSTTLRQSNCRKLRNRFSLRGLFGRFRLGWRPGRSQKGSLSVVCIQTIWKSQIDKKWHQKKIPAFVWFDLFIRMILLVKNLNVGPEVPHTIIHHHKGMSSLGREDKLRRTIGRTDSLFSCSTTTRTFAFRYAHANPSWGGPCQRTCIPHPHGHGSSQDLP